MRQAIIKFLEFLPDWLEIIVISAIPVIELRVAIPLAILHYGMSFSQAYLFGVIGTLIPAPFILLFIPAILKWMAGTKIFGKMANWLINKGMKTSDKFARYEFWGLLVFAAIPLPGFGVWTGCLAAALLGLDFKKSMIAVTLGTMVAGAIVTGLVMGGLLLV